MANSKMVARVPGTAWGGVLGGWLATIGASVIFAPVVAGVVAGIGAPTDRNDLSLAVPVVLGLFLSYIVGGYVAGRMAGYRTSWHGMMTAFFSLFVLLVLMLLGAAAENGIFASSGIRSAADIVPGVRDLNLYAFGDALTFGAILGFLAAIFGGWLGGLLAPTHATVTPVTALPAPQPARAVERHEAAQARRPLVPAFGRKGGDLVEKDEVRASRVEDR